MSWNGSGKGSGAAVASPQNTNKKDRIHSSDSKFNHKHSLFAALAIVVLLLCITWILHLIQPSKLKNEEMQMKSGDLISAVTPAIIPQTEKKLSSAKMSPSHAKPFWEQENTNGFNEAMMRKWKFKRRPKAAFTNDMAKNIPKLKCEIFDTMVENEIAVMMTLEPGKSIIGMPNYNKGYDEEFKKSCEKPIIIEKDDDDYTKQLKREMIQVKIELCDRIRNGENLADILRETRIEAQRLSALKEDIVEAMRTDIRETGATGDAEEMYYQAANKLLERNGIAPIKRLSINRYALKRRIDKQKKGNLK